MHTWEVSLIVVRVSTQVEVHTILVQKGFRVIGVRVIGVKIRVNI